MAPFDTSHVSYYWSSTVTMALITAIMYRFRDKRDIDGNRNFFHISAAFDAPVKGD